MENNKYRPNDVVIVRQYRGGEAVYLHKMYKYYIRGRYAEKGYVIIGRLRKYISKQAFKKYRNRPSRLKKGKTTKFAMQEWLQLRRADYRTKGKTLEELLSI